MTPQDYAKRALKFYFDALKSSPFQSLQAVVDHMEIEDDGFRSNELFFFGNSVKILGDTKTKSAMQRLAQGTTIDRVPTRQAFYDALSDSAKTLTFEQVKTATTEGLKDAAKATATVAGGLAVGGLALYAVYIFGGLLAFQLLRSSK